MAKKNKELEEYLLTHEIEAPQPKSVFRDTRMDIVHCPLCGEVMRLIRLEEHTFGEFGLYQCPDCGSLIDICNMVNSPQEIELVSKLSHGKYFQSLRTILKTYGDFTHLPKEHSIHHVAAEKEKKIAAKQDRMEFCLECRTKFTPQKSCIAVRDYCSSCRKDIPKDDSRWKNDVKAKKKVVKTKDA